MLQEQQECKRISIQTLSLDLECRNRSTNTPTSSTSRNRTRNFQQFLIEKDGYKVLSTLNAQKTPQKTDRSSRLLIDKQTNHSNSNNTYRHLSEQQVDLKDFYKLIITSHENSSLTSKTTRSQVLNKLLNNNNFSQQATLVGGNNQLVEKNIVKGYSNSSSEMQGFQTPKRRLNGNSSQIEDIQINDGQKLILLNSNIPLNENEPQIIEEENTTYPSERTNNRNNDTSPRTSYNNNQASKSNGLGVAVQRMSKIFDFDSVKKSQELYALSRRKFSFSKEIAEEGNGRKDEQIEGIDSKGKYLNMRSISNNSVRNVESQNMLQYSQPNSHQTRRSSFIKQNWRQQQQYQVRVHHNQRYSVSSNINAQVFGDKHFEIGQKAKVSQETQCEFSQQSCHESSLKNSQIEINLAENNQILEIQTDNGKETKNREDISLQKGNNILAHSILTNTGVPANDIFSQSQRISQSAQNQLLKLAISDNKTNDNSNNISLKLLTKKPNISSYSSPAFSDKIKSVNQSQQLQQQTDRDMLSNRRVVLSRLRLRNKTAEKYSSSQDQLLQIITQPLHLISNSIATAETEPSCPPIITTEKSLSRTNQHSTTRSTSVNSKRIQSADSSNLFLQKSLSPEQNLAKKIDAYSLKRAPLKIMTLVRGLSWNARQLFAEQTKKIFGNNEQYTQEQLKQQQQQYKNEKITEKKSFYTDWNKFQLVQAAFNENKNNNNFNSKTPKQIF